MPNVKKPVTFKRKRRANNFNVNDVLAIIDEVYETYSLMGTRIEFGMMLVDKGLSPTTMQYWRDNYEEVREAYAELKAIQKLKIQAGLYGDNGAINPTGLIFMGKVNHGMVEESIRMKIESDKDIATLDRDTIINIGWDDKNDSN